MSNQKQEEGSREDEKEMVIAGCTVRLKFTRDSEDRWSVNGTVQCGVEENRATESVQTGAYGSREEAEQAAISQITAMLGNNQDRNTSRVRNWG